MTDMIKPWVPCTDVEAKYKGTSSDVCKNFNSALRREGADWVLTIYFRMFLNKIDPPPEKVNDYNGNPFFVAPWGLDFAEFERDFYSQVADAWDRRFYLRTPDNFDGFDVPNGKGAYRHNVACRLELVKAKGKGDAHKVLNAIKIDKVKQKAADSAAHKLSVFDSSYFRSDAGTMDSLDTIESTYPDVPVVCDRCTKESIVHRTIPHEFGHHLGLPHIGETERLPACVADIKKDPAKGVGSLSCYGSGAPEWMAKNVMGFGTQFHAVNAKPWVDRIAEHTNVASRYWQASLDPVVPRWIGDPLAEFAH